MPLSALIILASALPFGPPVDSDALARIAGNGTGTTGISTNVVIPGLSIAHADATDTAGAGLAAGGDRSSISILLRFGGINMDGRRMAGPLTIALHTDSNIGPLSLASCCAMK